jgi:hypothetical protein
VIAVIDVLSKCERPAAIRVVVEACDFGGLIRQLEQLVRFAEAAELQAECMSAALLTEQVRQSA